MLNPTLTVNDGGGNYNFCMTLDEIGNSMQVTRERVRQIQEKALGKVFKKIWRIYPECNAFEIMAMLIVGFKIKGNISVKGFYFSFPSMIRRAVLEAAYLHAPYMKRVEEKELLDIVGDEGAFYE